MPRVPKRPRKPAPEVPSRLTGAPEEDSFLARQAHGIALESVLRNPLEPVTTVDQLALRREEEVLSAALLEEMRELGKEDYGYFLQNCLFPGETWTSNYTEGFHGPLIQEIQDLPQGHNLWFFLYREARKTFLMSIGRHIWDIIRDPDVRLLLVGAREETVKPQAILIRNAFVPGFPGFERFQEIYWDHTFAAGRGGGLQYTKQAFQFMHPLRRKALPDPTFRASYLGVTGAGWRCDRLTIDDPIERRNVSTPEQAGIALTRMLDLLPLVDLNSKYRNIFGAGTRWAYFDPYGKIMGENREGEQDETKERLNEMLTRTRVIIRHALEDPSVPCDDCPPHIVARYPHGKFDLDTGVPPAFPVHTREMILSRYQEYCLDPEKGESLFYHQYGNICRSPKDQKFRKEWIVTAPFPYWSVWKKRVLVTDAADKDFQEAGTGDWMVALMGEFDDFGRLLLVHGLRDRSWTRAQFQDRILAWCLGSGWWPQVVAKEKHGESGGSWLTDIGRKFLEHEKPVHLVPVLRPLDAQGQKLKKYDYITGSLQAPMERCEVVFGSAFPAAIRERAGYELTHLGQLRVDDVADALAIFFDPKIRLIQPAQISGASGLWVPPSLANYGGPDPAGLQALQGAVPGLTEDPYQEIYRRLEQRGHLQGIPMISPAEPPDAPPPGGFQIIIP